MSDYTYTERALERPPHSSTTICKFYRQGYCHRGAKCWFLHPEPGHATQQQQQQQQRRGGANYRDDTRQAQAATVEDREKCAICLEVPDTYGMLEKCSHAFCLSCIKQWRQPEHKESQPTVDSGAYRQCPICREWSNFITPSSIFHKTGPSKDHAITEYKRHLSVIECRYLVKSLESGKPFCPFADSCFYSHTIDGQTVTFGKSIEEMAAQRARRANFDAHLDDIVRLMRSHNSRSGYIRGIFDDRFDFLDYASGDDYSLGGLSDSLALGGDGLCECGRPHNDHTDTEEEDESITEDEDESMTEEDDGDSLNEDTDEADEDEPEGATHYSQGGIAERCICGLH